MALTSASATKALFETLGYGCPWFVDRAAQTKSDGQPQGLPFGVFQGNMNNVGRRRGNGRTRVVDELGQLDFIQDKKTENRTFFDRIYNDLDGARLMTAPKQVFRVEVQSAQRPTPSETDEIVRYTYSITFKRSI